MAVSVLLSATFALVLAGAIIYDAGRVGWAQLFFVLASGTAGAGVALLAESRSRDGR